MAQLSRNAGRFFCSIFIVVGLIAAGAGGWNLVKGIRTEQWPVANGIVMSAKVVRNSGGRGSDTYSPEIWYSYHVAGMGYTGKKISIGQMSSSSGYAQGVVGRYPVGKQVTVHYNPADPAEAVLETGVHGGTWILFGVGGAFILVGFLFLQIQTAIARAQAAGGSTPSVTVLPDGQFTMQEPPALMGVIFILAGAGICFLHPADGVPHWIVIGAGIFFVLMGIFLLLRRLKNKLYAKIAMAPVLLTFLAILHWVSFGAGERAGTVTTPFSAGHAANIRTPFAIFTVAIDVIIVASLVYRLWKRNKD
ncbi:MAG TPA: DUF3592 domain-containing protein [Verrucomicrobiae bacterium]|nr:DUF3592 domain-containing protein [Verrucomicrobiae bacterium]